MACHDTYQKNNLAPPIVAINRIYTDTYKKDKELAKKAIIRFLEKPSLEKAIMKPAIKLFNLMPKLELSLEQRRDFADVIMGLDYEKPEWFENHYKSHKLDLEHKDIN